MEGGKKCAEGLWVEADCGLEARAELSCGASPAIVDNSGLKCSRWGDKVSNVGVKGASGPETRREAMVGEAGAEYGPTLGELGEIDSTRGVCEVIEVIECMGTHGVAYLVRVDVFAAQEYDIVEIPGVLEFEIHCEGCSRDIVVERETQGG